MVEELRPAMELETIQFSSNLARLESLISGVVHQLRNPLNSMGMRLELLRNGAGQLSLGPTFLLGQGSVAIQILITCVLLATVAPILLLLVALALLAVLSGRWADDHVERGRLIR